MVGYEAVRMVSYVGDLPHALQIAAHWMFVPQCSATQSATVTGVPEPLCPSQAGQRDDSTVTHCFASPLQIPVSVCSDFIQIFIYSRWDTFQ